MARRAPAKKREFEDQFPPSDKGRKSISWILTNAADRIDTYGHAAMGHDTKHGYSTYAAIIAVRANMFARWDAVSYMRDAVGMPLVEWDRAHHGDKTYIVSEIKKVARERSQA